MALSAPNILALQSSSDAHGTASFTTASLTIPANSLVQVFVSATLDSNDGQDVATAITLSSSNGLTFTSPTQADAETLSAGATVWSWGSRYFYAQNTTGASVTFTVDAGAMSMHKWHVQVVTQTGHDTVTPVKAVTAANRAYTVTDGAASLTLPTAPVAGSYVFGVMHVLMNSGAGAVGVGTGCTEMFDATVSDWVTVQGQYRTGSTSATFPWADVNNGAGAILGAVYYAVEVQAATAGSPYSLTAEQGTYTLTGQATLARRTMVAGQGTFSLTGQDAGLSKSGGAYSLTADVGLFTLFGSEAQRDVSMTAEQGTFALTGTAANMLRAYRMTAAQASFVLTGRAATLSYSANPAPEVPPVSTGGGGPLKSAYVYVVATTGRAKWVDYIPVRQVVPGSGATNTFANDGAIGVTMLANVTGLREWVDYIPVVEVADSVNRWRQENDGWIPIVAL